MLRSPAVRQTTDLSRSLLPLVRASASSIFRNTGTLNTYTPIPAPPVAVMRDSETAHQPCRCICGKDQGRHTLDLRPTRENRGDAQRYEPDDREGQRLF